MKNIHETATVASAARIGDFTSIWHYSHVESRAVVGENCNLGQGVYVGNDAKIGNGCRIGNSVSIFSNVELEDFVFCAPFMVFTHISFPRAAVSRKNIFEKTVVQVGATLGANSTVVPGITVGKGAFLAAGAILTKTCKDWALMVGAPARQIGWVSAFGEKIPLPLCGSGSWLCSRTGDAYVLEGEDMTRHAGPTDILNYVPGKPLDRLVLDRI